ncbi:YceI family protein, partial [Methylobrevis pamukkalensis]|uniref:YceI family protein n=1 Tax=Methylobrevis pamukkalensis TaxID=1439726 RepID=UPI000845FC04
MKKILLLASALVLTTATAQAADKYTLDPSHSQVVFTYNHLGYSNTVGMFSGFTGDIMLDAEDPSKSTVSVSIDTASLITGWPERDAHFKTGDFFDAEAAPKVTFVSTNVEVTGEKTANITGDLTLNGITKPVVLEATLNQMGEHPMAKKPWAGFDATATIKRSD